MSDSALPAASSTSTPNNQSILSFAFMHSHQQLLRLSVSAILHSLRVTKVPRNILDLLSQVMAAFMQRLFERLSSLAIGEGRYRLTLGEDSLRLIDMFITGDRLFVGGYSPLFCMESRLPVFELEQLLDYAHHQQRVVSAVKKRTAEEEDYRSIYEEAGLINPQYALVPLPAKPNLTIILSEAFGDAESKDDEDGAEGEQYAEISNAEREE